MHYTIDDTLSYSPVPIHTRASSHDISHRHDRKSSRDIRGAHGENQSGRAGHSSTIFHPTADGNPAKHGDETSEVQSPPVPCMHALTVIVIVVPSASHARRACHSSANQGAAGRAADVGVPSSQQGGQGEAKAAWGER
jgi:hypothetical protein